MRTQHRYRRDDRWRRCANCASAVPRHPYLHHDLSALRRLTLHEALHTSGASLDLLEPAFEVFYAARNQVVCYPMRSTRLARIAARVPVAALSNGNADLERIGLAHHFAFQLGSREPARPSPKQHLPCRVHPPGCGTGTGAARRRPCRHGRGRGDCRRPARLLDQPRRSHLDHPQLQPDLQFDTLTGLADWLDANLDAAAPRST